MNDVGHRPIGHVVESFWVECPVCGEDVLAFRVLGVGRNVGMRWLTFFPHYAPCAQRCAGGGIVGDFNPAYVHTGPKTCECCSSGHHDVGTVQVVLVDETGDLQVAWSEDEYDDDEREPYDYEDQL